MNKDLNNIEGDDNMLAIKKETTTSNVKFVPAKVNDVMKAIKKSNVKHSEMFNKLSK